MLRKAQQGFRRPIAIIALLAVLLRVLVPAGYMPVALSEGWFLSLCPHGLSTHATNILFPATDRPSHDPHAHHRNSHSHSAVQHGHMGHAPMPADAQSANSSSAGALSDHCELGSGFALAAALDTVLLAIALLLRSQSRPSRFPQFLSLQSHRLYNPRAPPSLH